MAKETYFEASRKRRMVLRGQQMRVTADEKARRGVRRASVWNLLFRMFRRAGK